MIRNLQVLAIALLVSSVSLAFGQEKEADNAVAGKSVRGDDGTKQAAPSAATPKMKPGKEKKVYVGTSHEAGKKAAVDAKPEGKRRRAWQFWKAKDSEGEKSPKKPKS